MVAFDDHGNPCVSLGDATCEPDHGFTVRLQCTSRMGDFGDPAIAAENRDKPTRAAATAALEAARAWLEQHGA